MRWEMGSGESIHKSELGIGFSLRLIGKHLRC